MSIILEEIALKNEHSFRSKIDVLPHIQVPWHYHPHFELQFIERSKGTRIVGDCIDTFTEGDMVFMGPNLPHVWKNDDSYYQKNPDLRAVAWVVHFRADVFGPDFFEVPEMSRIKRFLSSSGRGIRIEGSTKYKMIQIWQKLNTANFTQRIIYLLEMLDTLAQSDDLEYLASEDFARIFQKSSNQKLYQIYEFVSRNFQQKIDLEQVAHEASMSKTAFCRFFKNQTGKTFSEFLNEMRINYARKLLAEGKLSISQIAYECGFNSPSYFNRQFKAHTGKAPKEQRTQVSKL
ncbi:MAG: AraC family transcriptional regulator [Marinifilaceae bacterium]